MPVKVYKKNDAGLRFASVDTFEDITKSTPEKSLLAQPLKRQGRSFGSITVRHRGGGNRHFYRLVDFKQTRFNQEAKVLAIEYDPNRSTRIALIQYPNGDKSYILAPVGLLVGNKVLFSNEKIEAGLGNRMPLSQIPVGYTVHNVEMRPGRGGQIVRSAGASAQLLGMEGEYALLRLPSGEVRRVFSQCAASIGQLSNPDHNLVRVGKAGRMRHMGWRPEVRGKAMNPVDHPHGGGEGHNPIGMRRPETPWGKPAFGVKTRKNKKWSDKFIIQRRKK